jgi:predicted naringenin-chalcone synthase
MLIHIVTSVPPNKVSQARASEEIKKRMASRPGIGRLIDNTARNSGIESRYTVVPDANADSPDKFYSVESGAVVPDTRTRMTEYEKWSKVLAKDAVGRLIQETQCRPSSFRRIITVSCTGFYAPGLDYYLINEFNFSPAVQRTHIGFMGCAAAIVGITSVIESLSAAGSSEGTTLLAALEICSLHLHTEPTRDNILANMIFADGCAAVLFSKSAEFKHRLHLLFTDSYLFSNSSEFMGWKIGNTGFEMILSSELPRIILEEAVPVIKKVLGRYGLDIRSVNHWALHPGGRAILDSLQSGLELSDADMKPSRDILRNYGNMSSPSIIFVLKELLESGNVLKNEHVCAVAFGPGLTMEIALMKGA